MPSDEVKSIPKIRPDRKGRAVFYKWAKDSKMYHSPVTGLFCENTADSDFDVWQASRRAAFDRAVEIASMMGFNTSCKATPWEAANGMREGITQALAEERDKGNVAS